MYCFRQSIHSQKTSITYEGLHWLQFNWRSALCFSPIWLLHSLLVILVQIKKINLCFVWFCSRQGHVLVVHTQKQDNILSATQYCINFCTDCVASKHLNIKKIHWLLQLHVLNCENKVVNVNHDSNVLNVFSYENYGRKFCNL